VSVLVAYVSGHGFGHFTRSEAVLERVARAGVAVHVRTDARALVLARRASWAASVTEVDSGPGVVQRGPIEVDLDATERALERSVAGLDALAAREASALHALSATAVYGDVPPIAFEAAHAAGLPSIGLANFSWSWIYQGYAAARPAFAALASRLERAERRADLFLTLPFAGGLDHFPRRESLPLVVRHPTRSREAARALLPLPRGEKRPVVLLSFGGFGSDLDLVAAARRNEGYFFVTFAPSPSGEKAENLATLEHDHGLPHQDLVLGADALLGKPGYGTVAEAIVARRPFVLTPRGDFREFAVLVRAIEEHLPHAHRSVEQLLSGEWSEALAGALAMSPPRPAPASDGAAVAARRILDWLVSP
jgi:hypothetical protein